MMDKPTREELRILINKFCKDCLLTAREHNIISYLLKKYMVDRYGEEGKK